MGLFSSKEIEISIKKLYNQYISSNLTELEKTTLLSVPVYSANIVIEQDFVLKCLNGINGERVIEHCSNGSYGTIGNFFDVIDQISSDDVIVINSNILSKMDKSKYRSCY